MRRCSTFNLVKEKSDTAGKLSIASGEMALFSEEGQWAGIFRREKIRVLALHYRRDYCIPEAEFEPSST